MILARLLSATLLALAIASTLGGCAAQPSAAADYNTLFAQHRYADSYDAAAKVAGSMHSGRRDQASLVAGLSARALDRTEDAKRWLTTVTNNADPSIAGQASAAMGAIAQEEGRHRDAAALFLTAGSKLSGDDAAHAFMYAGDSLKALQKPAEASAAWEKAKSLVANASDLRVAIGDRLAGRGPALAGSSGTGKYTVQTGAFSTLQKARTEARRFTSVAATKTVPIRDKAGRLLYAVQVGRFPTKQAADQFRRGLGRTAFVTAAE